MNVIKNYGLSITLIALFLASWFGQYYYQWEEFVSNQEEHGEEAEFEDYWPEFMAATFENWQSEFLQLFTFVILSTYLIHKNSPQSRDGDDEMKAMLQRIEKKLNSRK